MLRPSKIGKGSLVSWRYTAETDLAIWIWSQKCHNLMWYWCKNIMNFCVCQEGIFNCGRRPRYCKTGHVRMDTICMTSEKWWQLWEAVKFARGTKKEEETKESKPESDEESSSSSSSTEYDAFTAGTTETACICAAVIDTVIIMCCSMCSEDQNKSRWHRRQGHSPPCQFLARVNDNKICFMMVEE